MTARKTVQLHNANDSIDDRAHAVITSRDKASRYHQSADIANVYIYTVYILVTASSANSWHRQLSCLKTVLRESLHLTFDLR